MSALLKYMAVVYIIIGAAVTVTILDVARCLETAPGRKRKSRVGSSDG